MIASAASQSTAASESAALPPRPSARVLVVHNRYRYPGGEDAVVDAEAALLESRGHAVERFSRHNDDITDEPRLSQARDALWSPSCHFEVSQLIESFRPDVVHLHNVFPVISPSVIWAAYRRRVAVVQTIHNFRLICPQAMLLREGRVCEACVGKVPWRAVVHRCYRGSAMQSAAIAISLQSHRMLGTWRHKVARYIALNAFCKDKLIEGGLPAARIVVKPNFVDLEFPSPRDRSGLLFVGRASQEKGIEVLIEAARRLPVGVTISVVGDGPLIDAVRAAPALRPTGHLDADAIYAAMRQCVALVLPSIWYESFPRTLVEAYACGLPVIASRLGALSDLVQHERTGLLVNPGDPEALQVAMRWAMAHPDAMAAMGRAARSHYETHWGRETNYRQLVDIYGESMLGRAKR